MSQDRRHTLPGGRLRRGALLLWRGVAAHPRTYVAAIVTSGLFGGLTVAISQVLGKVTDQVVVPAIGGDAVARDALWLAGLAILGVAVTLALAVAGRRIFAGIGYADIGAGHRRGVTRQYLRLPMSWHRAHPTGQLLANTSSDVEAATGVFNPLPFALGVVVMIVVATVALLRTDVWLALTALTVLPLAVLANLVYQRRMSPVATRAQQLRAEVSDVAHESFEAALLVKSLGTADVEEARFAAVADRLREANVQVGRVRAVFDPVIELLPSVGTLAVLLVGAGRLSAGAVQTGDVVGAAYLLTLMAVPVRAFGWVLGELPRALVGHDRISRVLDARADQVPGTAALPRAAGGLDVRLRGVSVEVEDARARTPCCTTSTWPCPRVGWWPWSARPARARPPWPACWPGCTTRRPGRSCSTASTWSTSAAQDLTAQVALVAQSTFVFEDSVRANVTLADVGDPSAPSDEAVWDALTLAQVDRVIRALPDGLDAKLGERGANLSGGQRQRLAIARAVVRRPRLLVLDDATSAVDPQVERRILTGLRRRTEESPTVLLVAYRMSSVLLADEVVHLDGGRVVDRGTHAELLARDPGYRALATAYEVDSERRAVQ